MKTALRLIFFFFFLSTQVAAKEPITLTTFNLPHYGYFPKEASIMPIADSTFTGEAVDTVRCAFKSLPFSLKIKVMPWKRAQLTVKQGLADGFFSASQNKNRDKYAQFSAPIADQQWLWYFKQTVLVKPTDKDFKQKARIGALNGSLMKSWLIENDYTIGVNAQSSDALFRSLLIGRIDSILANKKVINALMTEESNAISSMQHSVRPLGVYFSNTFLAERPEFLARFNEQVQLCRKSY